MAKEKRANPIVALFGLFGGIPPEAWVVLDEYDQHRKEMRGVEDYPSPRKAHGGGLFGSPPRIIVRAYGRYDREFIRAGRDIKNLFIRLIQFPSPQYFLLNLANELGIEEDLEEFKRIIIIRLLKSKIKRRQRRGMTLARYYTLDVEPSEQSSDEEKIHNKEIAVIVTNAFIRAMYKLRDISPYAATLGNWFRKVYWRVFGAWSVGKLHISSRKLEECDFWLWDEERWYNHHGYLDEERKEKFIKEFKEAVRESIIRCID